MFPVYTIDPIDSIEPIDAIDPIDSKTETGPIRHAEQSGFRPRLDTAISAIFIIDFPDVYQDVLT